MRPIQPHDFQSPGSHSRERQPESSASPARRGQAIKLRACTECRKKRAKCDGQRPCGRCRTHRLSDCRDDIAIRQSKAELRMELKRLRERQDSIDHFLSLVVEPELSLQILGRLREGHSLNAILDWVREAHSSTVNPGCSALPALPEHDSHESSHKPSPGKKLVQDEVATDRPNNAPGPEQILWPRGAPPTTPSLGVWTDVSGDTLLIRHLLALYFCWEYPVFASLSREHFMDDFHQGRRRYCSPLLVNSLLALGSLWTTRPDSWSNPNDGNPSGDSFFAESVRLLNQETDRRSLTTVQALSLMAIREISCGRNAEGRYYCTQSVRLAVDMGLHRKVEVGDSDLLCVQTSTFWGAFSLDTMLSAATGSLPQYPHVSPLPPKPALLADVEEGPWMPYTDDGLSRQSAHKQTSNAASIHNCFCQLTETISRTLYTLYSPVSVVTGEVLLSVYTVYLNWYDQMPEVLRLGLNSTPSVLFSHMSYHFAIIHLFRPFLDLHVLGSDISPGRICHQAADAIQGLLRSYSQLYTLHRTPALVPCLALASAISHLDKRTINMEAPSPSFDSDTEMATVGSTGHHIFNALDQDISDLREMATCHYSASQALGLLGGLGKSLKVEMDTGEATFSAKDYDRLVKPYMRRSKLETRRVESNGFLLNEWRAAFHVLSPRLVEC